MGARKGQNNFKAHQSDVVNVGVKRVLSALKAVPTRARFEDFNALARYVAVAAGMHPTTMTRSPRYKKLVWDYIRSRPRIISDNAGPTLQSTAPEVASIEAALLKREIARLRKMMSLQISHASTSSVPLPAVSGEGAAAGDLRRSFELTATVLARLLNWATEKEIGIITDATRGEILDAAEVGGTRVIAKRPDTTAFFDWLKTHSAHAATPNRPG